MICFSREAASSSILELDISISKLITEVAKEAIPNWFFRFLSLMLLTDSLGYSRRIKLPKTLLPLFPMPFIEVDQKKPHFALLCLF